MPGCIQSVSEKRLALNQSSVHDFSHPYSHTNVQSLERIGHYAVQMARMLMSTYVPYIPISCIRCMLSSIHRRISHSPHISNLNLFIEGCIILCLHRIRACELHTEKGLVSTALHVWIWPASIVQLCRKIHPPLMQTTCAFRMFSLSMSFDSCHLGKR